MKARRRDALQVLASLVLVLVGVGIGWLLFSGPDPEPRAEPKVEPGPRKVPSPPPKLEGHAPAARPSGDGAERKGGEGSPPSVAPGRGAGGRIHVVLDVPESWPLLRGQVYALPAGSDGVAEEGSVPYTQLWNNEVELLEVPFAGTWDVFYAADWSTGAALDVVVPAGGVVDVRLAPHASGPIVFRLEDDLPSSWLDALLPGVEVTSPRSSGAPAYPGRADEAPISTWVLFDDHGTAATRPLPAGRIYEAHPIFVAKKEADRVPGVRPFRRPSGSHRLMLERRAVEAGDTVSVHVLPRARLSIKAHLDRRPPASWEGWTAHAALRLRVPGGEGEVGSLAVQPGDDPSTRLTWVLWSDPGSGRLEWGGQQGIGKDALDGIRLAAGETTEVEIVLRVDPTFSPKVAYRTKPEDLVHVRVDGWPEPVPADAELVLFGLNQDADPGESCESLQLDYPQRRSWHRQSFEPRTVMAILPPDLASRPATVTPAGELHLELEPAGYLMVVPDRILAPGAGGLVLERADGQPFPVGYAESVDRPPEPTRLGVRVSVCAGWLVGPLLPGRHRFHATLGGVPLPDAVGRVVAGHIEVLRVRAR